MEKYRKIINDFIVNYNGNEKLTFGVIRKELDINLTYIRNLSDRDLIKDKNKKFIPNWVYNKKERQNSKEYKDKQKKWRYDNKDYIKEQAELKSQIILAKRREKIYQEIDVKSFQWKDILGYEGKYKISSGGHVINLKRMVLINYYKMPLGYINVSLNGKNQSLHRIIAEAFIPNPDNKLEVNHKNGIRNDNRIENLEWCTRAENVQHSFKELGRKSNFTGNGGRKEKYPKKEIIELLKQKIDYKVIISKYGMSKEYLDKIRWVNKIEAYMSKLKS